MDLAKYRIVFIEESTDHLAQMSTSLMELEKYPDRSEAIDVIFRMAHSIKGMAASLEYDSITEVAHLLEDRMHEIRAVGRVTDPEDMGRLFKGLECLEAMVQAVRDTGEPPPPDPAILAQLDPPALDEEADGDAASEDVAKKKFQRLTR